MSCSSVKTVPVSSAQVFHGLMVEEAELPCRIAPFETVEPCRVPAPLVRIAVKWHLVKIDPSAIVRTAEFAGKREAKVERGRTALRRKGRRGWYGVA